METSSSESVSLTLPTPVSGSSFSIEGKEGNWDGISSQMTTEPRQHEAEAVEEAVELFLSQWSNPDIEQWWDILEPERMAMLPPYTARSLGAALQAVSVMIMALHQSPESESGQRLTQLAAKVYGGTLRSINLALENHDECLKDSTVLAVILTAMFEVREQDHAWVVLTML